MFQSSVYVLFIFFFKQKTAYEMRISDWSLDVCSSDLEHERCQPGALRNAGAADRERDPDVFLVGRCLADELAMLAHVPAVVGGVHDVGVVELAGLAQRRDHAGKEGIDRRQHGEGAAVVLVGAGIGRARWRESMG